MCELQTISFFYTLNLNPYITLEHIILYSHRLSRGLWYWKRFSEKEFFDDRQKKNDLVEINYYKYLLFFFCSNGGLKGEIRIFIVEKYQN